MSDTRIYSDHDYRREAAKNAELRAERDRYIRAFNRLEKAVTVALGRDEWDDLAQLRDAHAKILRDIGFA